MTNLKKMLIVDDSRVSRMMSSTFLKKLRPEVEIVEAADADSALSVLSQTPIDMCIIDFNMPGMDGLELAQEIKNQRSEARIALLTANVQDSIKERAEAIGVSFFRKPITESVITKILDELAPAA